MQLRGHRRCRECGERWSYFDTGAVECPACGSIRSVAVDDDPVRHTAGRTDLDLTEARAAAADRPLDEVAEHAARATRRFLADRGFIAAGELRPLDDVTIAAAELRAIADHVRHTMIPDEDAEWYLVALLGGAPNGDRPDEVPASLRAVRGRGVAAAVDRYRSDLTRFLNDHPDPAARRAVGTLRDILRRAEALDGDVPAGEVDRLLAAARDLGAYLRGDEGALTRATDRLDRI